MAGVATAPIWQIKTMKIAISAPSGYNARELLLPLKPLLDQDSTVTNVYVISPAAEHSQVLFPDYSQKYHFLSNPKDQAGHDSLLQKVRPDVVVTPTIGLDPLDPPIIRAAKRYHIPTCTFVASWDNIFKMEHLKRFGHHTTPVSKPSNDYALPDYLAVWNQQNYDHVQKVFPELSASRITIVGSPRLDYFSHHDKIPSREELYAYLKLPNPENRLIHAGTTELYPFNYIIKQILKAKQNQRLSQKVDIYASVHPGGDISKHQKIKDLGIPTRYSFGYRAKAPAPDWHYLPTLTEIYLLVALFKHADILVNHSSTVALESMLADTPVINITYGRRFDWWRWRRSRVYRDFSQHYRYLTSSGGTSLVKRASQLIPTINNYLDHPEHKSAERAATIRSLITYTDGSSSKRLLDLIKKIAQ